MCWGLPAAVALLWEDGEVHSVLAIFLQSPDLGEVPGAFSKATATGSSFPL